jgi:hypothetical protein
VTILRLPAEGMVSNLLWIPLSEAARTIAELVQLPISKAAADVVLDLVKGREIKGWCCEKRWHAGEWMSKHGELDPSWLDFVAYQDIEQGHLRFNLADAGRFRQRGGETNPPTHAYEIGVEAARFAELVPDPDANESLDAMPGIVEVAPILPPAPVAPPESDKPKPSKQKERRQVREAIEVLATASDWSGLNAEPRRRRIEKHLNWLEGQCKPRTYDRALGDFEDAKSAVAPVGEVAQVPASS